jgi:DNA polymerase-3 subunit alpha
VFAVAETILAVASHAEQSRTSGQHGLFGEQRGARVRDPDCRKARIGLSPIAWRRKRKPIGFYFSAHPVDRYSHLAEGLGARSYAALCAQAAPIDGSRTAATMAGLIEDARWRTSARGRRYLMATCSDGSGQYIATCFDDDVSKELEEAARAGGCGLLTVELDRRPGEETPRVTVKRIQPFEQLAGSARLMVEVTMTDSAAIPALAALLEGYRGGRGELMLRAQLDGGASASVRLARDYLLDAELAARIEALPGILAVSLRSADPPRLALVS